MKRIRLAWDDCFARRNETGTGVYAARLLENLSGQSDLEVNVLSGWPPPSHGGILRRGLRFAGNMAWTHIDVPLRLRKGGYDLLHSPAFVAPVKAPCPVVITMHDITYLLYPAHFTRWWVQYMKSIAPVAVKSAAAIICGSEHSKRDLVEAYSLAPGKVHVVPYGVDHERFRPGLILNPDWARQAGIRPGYVLHVGGLFHRKNIPALLRAIAHLRSQGKWGDRQLVLAGAESPGIPGGDEIRDTIQQLELSQQVLMPGRIADENLPGLYANASLLVMPSLYEGFGFPVLEAMAAGIPVVASNTSSLPEVAGDAAILVPPHDTVALADAIFEVLTQPNKANEMRAKGLVWARQFSWQRTAAETVAVYRDVVG